MPKTLLNVDDKVTFTLLVDGGDGVVRAGCKAEGFKFVHPAESERLDRFWRLLPSAAVATATLVLVVWLQRAAGK